MTIGQLLKKMKYIQSGGGAKLYLTTHDIKINGKKPEGRNSKIKDGDVIWINDDLYKILSE